MGAGRQQNMRVQAAPLRGKIQGIGMEDEASASFATIGHHRPGRRLQLELLTQAQQC